MSDQTAATMAVGNTDTATRTYQALDRTAQDIRLLTLQPSLDGDAPLSCSLQIVSLLADPDFEAVSYAWGNPTITEPIILHNQTIQVAVSIWSALKAFRHATESRRLWIDVVCINQSDRGEKESQLQLMGSIYRKARVVRVWLGTTTKDDSDTIALLRDLATDEGPTNILRYNWDARLAMASLQQFFTKSWWHRLWVVQEAGCGRDVTFQIGHDIIAYDDLYRAYRAAVNHFTLDQRGFSYNAFDTSLDRFMSMLNSVALLHRVRKVCHTDALYSSQPSDVRHMSMIWMAIANRLRDRQATIPSDKLYALYGLLPMATAAQPGMQPSYALTTAAAFADVTYALMESSQTLMMFTYLGFRDSASEELPSWVPDWRLPSNDRHEFMRRVEREQIFNAALNTDFYLRRLSGNAICLKGFFIDVVQSCHVTMIDPSASPILDMVYDRWCEHWANMRPDKKVPDDYIIGSSAEVAFRLTMLWDCAIKDLDADEGSGSLQQCDQEGFNAMWNAHCRSLQISKVEEQDGVVDDSLTAQDAQRIDYMINCARHRKFFTAAGGSIGMSQANIKAGDHIFIVAGNTHPVVLRPSQTYADTWHAVAECYIHGWMYGNGVYNIELCKKFESFLDSRPGRAEKVSARNPVLDEIKHEPEPYWKWLIVE